MKKIAGAHIHVTGIVQGVGFRPFIYSLATRMKLNGQVRNTSSGVDIEVDGETDVLQTFVDTIRQEAPPMARIDSLEVVSCPEKGFSSFEIRRSESQPEDFIPISPDICTCKDCLHELFDPDDRRYRYPFINCTNCGPRFTIIEGIPYDRPKTTMKDFPLCPECAAEYEDPSNRRFHAQPVACPVCGPEVWLEESNKPILNALKDQIPDSILQQKITNVEYIEQAQQRLCAGHILAIKGLGGFHLACDATNTTAVSELRRRKLRIDKAFAIMIADIDTVKQHCYLTSKEQALLESHARPIVILKRRPESNIASEIAPGQDTIGVILPYTPLHALLLTGHLKTLVMTSGNLSEEPIAVSNLEARQRLSSLCDAFLMNNRPIRTRCDDSVAKVVTNTKSNIQQHSTLYLRRSRGYAPEPIHLPFNTLPILATGPELKNTFCLARGRYAFLSHHIGDLENYETLQSFEDGITHLEKLFRIKPKAIAYDLHPNYLASRYALERSQQEEIPTIGVQHHHAHIAACMIDNGLNSNKAVIGVALDGTGYGTDGNIWGGEFLIANYTGFKRAAHLQIVPLPGGDAATREPWRMTLAWLWQCKIPWEEIGELGMGRPQEKTNDKKQIIRPEVIRHQLEHRINAPLTSSMGRLFDAVAALAGVRQTINYEAQAAIEFEALVDPDERTTYPFEIIQTANHPTTVSPTPMFTALIADLHRKIPIHKIAARFHNGVATMIHQVVTIIGQESGITQVALSGGVWQNITLLTKTVNLLENDGFTVLTHHQIPPNDGGISLGQVVIGLNGMEG